MMFPFFRLKKSKQSTSTYNSTGNMRLGKYKLLLKGCMVITWTNATVYYIHAGVNSDIGQSRHGIRTRSTILKYNDLMVDIYRCH